MKIEEPILPIVKVPIQPKKNGLYKSEDGILPPVKVPIPPSPILKKDNTFWEKYYTTSEKERFEVENNKKLPENGYILYHVPQEMCIGQASSCIIRITFDKDALLKKLPEYDNAKTDEIRIAPLMQVELTSEGDAFRVEAESPARQPIDFIKGEYTQWGFKVTPLKADKQMLKLKIFSPLLVLAKRTSNFSVLSSPLMLFLRCWC